MSDNVMSDDGLDVGLDVSLLDQTGAEVRLRVEDAGDTDLLVLRLEVADHITWWKSLSYFPIVQQHGGFGGFGMSLGPELRVETKDDDHHSEMSLRSADITRYGIATLWKAGFLGFGAQIFSGSVNAWANRGRRIIWRWEKD
jgi:hypothetical protein